MLCANCGEPLELNRRNKKYCSANCAREMAAIKHKERNPRPNIERRFSGSVSELIVCVDLMKKGYNVFRSVSQHADCDIVIKKGSELKTVEVTTGYFSSTGKLWYPPHTKYAYDIMAVVANGVIHYIPEMK